jgi:hypothetical protein
MTFHADRRGLHFAADEQTIMCLNGCVVQFIVRQFSTKSPLGAVVLLLNLTPKCRTYDRGIRLSLDISFCHLIFR